MRKSLFLQHVGNTPPCEGFPPGIKEERVVGVRRSLKVALAKVCVEPLRGGSH